MRTPLERIVYIGWSPEELIPCTVAEESIRRTFAPEDTALRIRRISRQMLAAAYERRTIKKGAHQRWDVLSDAPMTTDHAIARFFIPWLCDYQGWALFTDGDILCLDSVEAIFTIGELNPEKAVFCVQHPPLLKLGQKKEGEVQTQYARKNWSSVMLFNCGHQANRGLTLEMLNTLPGRDLHRFCWLKDDEIGELHPRWNVLVNISPYQESPGIVHFTEGIPLIEGHQDDPYAEAWLDAARLAGFRLGATVPALD